MSETSLFGNTVESLMDGMNGMLATKTVVGEPIRIGETLILPLVDVSFGVGAGFFQNEKKNSGGGGLGGKMSPSAVLVIQNGTTKMVSVKNQDGISKLIDMIPDFVNKILNKKETKEEQEAKAEAAVEMQELLSEAVKGTTEEADKEETTGEAGK